MPSPSPSMQFIFSDISDDNEEDAPEDNEEDNFLSEFYHVVRFTNGQSGIVCRKWTRYEKLKGTHQE